MTPKPKQKRQNSNQTVRGKEKYKLSVRCRNCGRKWTLEVEKGLFFVEGASNSKYSSTPFTALSRNGDGYMWEEVVECPNCGTHDITKVYD